MDVRKFSGFLILLTIVNPAFAQGTRTWEQSRFEDLIKGTLHGVAARSAGGLELAPAFKPLSTTPSAYIWSIASDGAGNAYAAAGSPARVYRIAGDGKTSVIFEPQELQVQSLVVDKSGAIYAATNPDGKVYKLEHGAGSGKVEKAAGEKNPSVDSSWSSSVYFDPKTKYIWDLALDGTGNLFVATGDHGQIFRVNPKGEHVVFFKSDEAHIRVLAFDLKGNVIAGSDGSGLIYRISPDGAAFVLYSAPKKEITALAVDKEGNIYASAVGEKHASSPAGVSAAPVSVPAAASASGGQPGGAAPGGIASTAITLAPAGGAVTGGSEIYRIALDGSPARIWSSREDLVYALSFDPYGTLLAGTGNRGHIFAVGSEDRFTDLVTASASQVTAFAGAPGGGLYASTSNLGKVFLLGAAPATEGTYESDVFDARIFSRWGRTEFRGAGNVELFARSGNVDNPDRNWSDWKAIDLSQDVPAGIPSARFVQWKAVLHNGKPAPRVDSVILNYLPKNVAPDFDEVSIQADVRYQSLPKPAGNDSGQGHYEGPPPAIPDRDSIGVKWTVHDENNDQLVYAVYYRGDGESRWLLLKDNIYDKFYSFDASLLPDGGYSVKVVASDAPAHSPGEALTAERASARFEVDTTPPQINGLKAVLEGAQIHVTWSAMDSFSPIKRAEYSLDAGDWQFVEPVGQLSDSKTESYDLQTPASVETTLPARQNSKASAGPVEHVVVVRVYDRYNNMVSAKTVIRGK